MMLSENAHRMFDEVIAYGIKMIHDDGINDIDELLRKGKEYYQEGYKYIDKNEAMEALKLLTEGEVFEGFIRDHFIVGFNFRQMEELLSLDEMNEGIENCIKQMKKE